MLCIDGFSMEDYNYIRTSETILILIDDGLGKVGEMTKGTETAR
jgi:hypothetical protein